MALRDSTWLTDSTGAADTGNAVLVDRTFIGRSNLWVRRANGSWLYVSLSRSEEEIRWIGVTEAAARAFVAAREADTTVDTTASGIQYRVVKTNEILGACDVHKKRIVTSPFGFDRTIADT